jgi:hypothetical protein
MAETMSTAECIGRMAYGAGATAYFCLPDVTLTGALSFSAVAIVLLITTATGLPSRRARTASPAPHAVDSFTA